MTSPAFLRRCSGDVPSLIRRELRGTSFPATRLPNRAAGERPVTVGTAETGHLQVLDSNDVDARPPARADLRTHVGNGGLERGSGLSLGRRLWRVHLGAEDDLAGEVVEGGVAFDVSVGIHGTLPFGPGLLSRPGWGTGSIARPSYLHYTRARACLQAQMQPEGRFYNCHNFR